MPDDELLERVRELRARGRSPKEIARAIKVRPATVTPLIRRLAAAEPQEKEAPLIGCWVNQGWSSSVRFTGHPEWPDSGPGDTSKAPMTTRGASCARSARTSATATSITWWDCGPDGAGIPIALGFRLANFLLMRSRKR
jgi:hypothetical protein